MWHESLLIVVNQFGIAAICALLANAVISANWPCGNLTVFATRLAAGGLFGLGAIMVMTNPIPLQPGVIFDIRSLMIGLSTGLFGIVPGLAASVIAMAFRGYLGGPGAVPGVLSILITLISTAGWRLLQGSGRPGLVSLGVLGACCALFIAPFPFWPAIFGPALDSGILSIIVATNLLGALSLGSLIANNLHQAARREMLDRLAQSDPLTGILNRRGLVQGYERWSKTSARDQGALCIAIDINDFKQFNERHGHDAGDRCLIHVAEKLRGSLRSSDLLARMGGDEFVVIALGVTPELARGIETWLKSALTETTLVIQDGTVLQISLSFGFHHITAATPLDEALRRSDRLMMDRKHRHHGRAPLRRQDQMV